MERHDYRFTQKGPDCPAVLSCFPPIRLRSAAQLDIRRTILDREANSHDSEHPRDVWPDRGSVFTKRRGDARDHPCDDHHNARAVDYDVEFHNNDDPTDS